MNANIRIALIISTFVILWLFSGLFISSSPKESTDSLSSDLTKVQASQYKQRIFVPELSLQSRTEPYRVVELKAQVTGQLIQVPGRRGSKVEQGQPVCVIEPKDRKLRVDHAAAQLQQAQIAYRGAQQLKTAGYQSEFAIAEANAKLQSAKLSLRQSQIDLDNLSVNAPFPAIVEARPVEVGDFITTGQLCARLLELDPIKIVAQVSEADVAKLQLGDQGVAEFFTHENVVSTITYIAHEADAKTRSYRIEATATNTDFTLRAGMSGRVKIKQPPIEAHLISASFIVLDANGEPTVRAVDENNRVSEIAVTMVGETEQGIWVQGLPESINLITVGQSYVSDGELVDVSLSSSVQ